MFELVNCFKYNRRNDVCAVRFIKNEITYIYCIILDEDKDSIKLSCGGLKTDYYKKSDILFFMNKTVILDKDRNPYEQLYSHEIEYLENFVKNEFSWACSFIKSVYNLIGNPECCRDKKIPCKDCSSKIMTEWVSKVSYGFYLKKEFWLDVYKNIDVDELKYYPPLKFLNLEDVKVKEDAKSSKDTREKINKLKKLKINIYKCDDIYHSIYKVPIILKILEETPITKDVLNYVLKEYL